MFLQVDSVAGRLAGHGGDGRLQHSNTTGHSAVIHWEDWPPKFVERCGPMDANVLGSLRSWSVRE